MPTTIQSLEAIRHAQAVEIYMSRHFNLEWLDEIERRALAKYPRRPRPVMAAEPPPANPPAPSSPYIQGQPVSQASRQLAVEIARQQLPKRQPKRSRKILP